MAVRLLLLIVGLFHVANALWMLAFPRQWSSAVVHQPVPVHLELHFIADIGMAFLASGAALIWSARRGSSFAPWTIAGAVWPALHAAIHLREWVMEGLPATTGDILNEGIGVILTGMAGVLLAWIRQREGGLQ
jgi:hypothetical protein